MPNANGTAMITVTVMDDGGTANGGVDTVTQTFFVTVAAVNQAPTLATIPNPAPILENAGQQTVTLSGIADGPGDTGQTLTVTAMSSNPGVIPNPTGHLHQRPTARPARSPTPRWPTPAARP